MDKSKEVQKLIDDGKLDTFFYVNCCSDVKCVDYSTMAPVVGENVATMVGYGTLRELPESQMGGCDLFVVDTNYPESSCVTRRVSLLLYEQQKELMESILGEESRKIGIRGQDYHGMELIEEEIDKVGAISFITLEMLLRASRRGIHQTRPSGTKEQLKMFEKTYCPEISDPKNKDIVYEILPTLLRHRTHRLLGENIRHPVDNDKELQKRVETLSDAIGITKEKLVDVLAPIGLRSCVHHDGYVGGCVICPAVMGCD